MLSNGFSHFSDDSDNISIGRLNFFDLICGERTANYSGHVTILKTNSGCFLLIQENQSIGNIDDNDFSTH